MAVYKKIDLCLENKVRSGVPSLSQRITREMLKVLDENIYAWDNDQHTEVQWHLQWADYNLTIQSRNLVY